MSDNKKDPRDIERRPPELRSNRRPSSDKSKKEKSGESSAPVRIEKRPVELQDKNTKSKPEEQKKATEAKSAKNAGTLPEAVQKTGKTSNSASNSQSPAVHKDNKDDREQRPVELRDNNTKSNSAAKNNSEHTSNQTNKNSRLSEQEKRLESRKKAILREARKREYSLRCFNIAVIVAIFAGIALFINFGERPTTDEDERRKLAERPGFTWSGYFDGSFTSGFSAWFNDAVPSRSTFKNFIAAFRTALGIEYDGGVTIIGPPPVIDNGDTNNTPNTPTSSSNKPNVSGNSSTPQQSGAAQTSSTSTSAEKPVVEPADGDGDMSGSVFVLGSGQGFSLFGGSYAGGQDYAETVSEIKAQVGGGVRFYSMVVPTSGSFYLPDKYKSYMASEWDNIENINSYLVDVTPVDAYSALAAHANEYIYFRTDHHWQQLGAYYAAAEFAKAAGVPFAPLSEYTKQDRAGMLGSLWGYSNNNPNMKKNPDTFTWYKPSNDFTVTVYDPDYTNPRKMPLILDDAHFSVNNSYMLFGGDIQINHVQTDCTNGRKLVIIGDSYDNALFLNLTNSFSEIWVVDMRAHLSTPYFDLNIVDFIQKMGASDVLFCMDTFSAVGGNRNGLKTMLSNPKTLPEN